MDALPTNWPTDKPTDRPTDTAYYRDTRTHLKTLDKWPVKFPHPPASVWYVKDFDTWLKLVEKTMFVLSIV